MHSVVRRASALDLRVTHVHDCETLHASVHSAGQQSECNRVRDPRGLHVFARYPQRRACKVELSRAEIDLLADLICIKIVSE